MKQLFKSLLPLFFLIFLLTACAVTLPETTLPSSSSDPIIEKPLPQTTVSLTESEPPTSDPYVDIDKDAFYANYHPATSLADALYRTEHCLMSGSIAEQDQRPSIDPHRPKKNGLLIRNTEARYGNNGNSYDIVDAEGKVVNRIYKGGAYVTLEEVAAYLLAFGDIPPNYTAKKSVKSYDTMWEWGQYLRCNHSKFSGDTHKYPYEPALPRITGIGGDLTYYEIDIGTTGTDCDPAYSADPYNNGSRITRGAARIVYTRFDADNNAITDINEKYVFYTYNHYNDFQEYLNYQGGWGELFGNITGGGKLSSKTDCNPTPYVKTLPEAFSQATASTLLALPLERSDKYRLSRFAA